MANIRMSDIAQRIDVSTVAVSKALAGKNGVSEELRARIRETAKAMGYVYPFAEKSRTGGGSNIGVLIPSRYLDSTETSFYCKLYQGGTACAMELGCFVMLELLTGAGETGGFPGFL